MLRDEERGRIIPESSPIIEYLTLYYPGLVALIPRDPELAWQVRAQDRLLDLYIHNEMQKIVGDRLRPADKKDPLGVEQARAQIATCYNMLERDMASKIWAVGDDFTMADCAAAPALFYANMVMPFGATHPNTAAYLGRLMARPSYARVLKEAQPYFANIPR